MLTGITHRRRGRAPTATPAAANFVVTKYDEDGLVAAVLKLEEVSFSYPGRSTPALSSVSAELEGSLVTILGPNGAGKSTLFKILATAATPTEGQFALDGVVVSGRGRDAYRRQLGWMPQHLGMFAGSKQSYRACCVDVARGRESDRQK